MPAPVGEALPVIEAARLRLRPARPDDDAGDLFAVFGDPEVMRYWSHEPFAGLDIVRVYIDGMEAGFASGTRYQWVVAERETDRAMGTVTLYHWDTQNRRAEVGYILGRAHWGQGYAREAVRALLRFAFDRLDLHRVEADVHPDNAPSLRLLERLGFRREGLLRQRWFTYGAWSDSVVLGLLRDEFAG